MYTQVSQNNECKTQFLVDGDILYNSFLFFFDQQCPKKKKKTVYKFSKLYQIAGLSIICALLLNEMIIKIIINNNFLIYR